MVKRLMPIIAALLLSAVAQVHALSLGGITLESAAGEPLQATVELLDSDGLSVSDISAMVASAADFQRFDAERIAVLDSISVTVEFVSGSPVLRLSSPVSIDEPFLSLILDTRWPAGRILTEYTLRLESPSFSAQSNQQVSAAPVQSVFEPVAPEADVEPASGSDADADTETLAQAEAADLAQSETATAASGSDTNRTVGVAPATAQDNEQNSEQAQSQPTRPAPVAAPDDLANASTLTVNAGDTLWELALRARPDDSVSVQQTMLALQRLNPDAFLGDNINRVKRGEVLRVPELSQIRQLAAAEAIAEVTRQNLEFRQGAASVVGSEPVTAGPDAATGAAGQGQLRVVTADEDSDDSADASASAASTQSAEQQIARNDEQLDALEDAMAQREEELDRLDLENTELNSRLAMLQQQITSAQEIIRLRDLELAQLQAQLAEADPADAASDATGEEQTTTITMAPDAGPVERFFNFLISNTWALLAAAAVLILLLVLVLMRRNRAAMSDEQRAQRDNDDMPLGDDSDDELLFSGVAAAAAAAEEADEARAGADNPDREDKTAQDGTDPDDDGVTYSPSGTLASDPGSNGDDGVEDTDMGEEQGAGYQGRPLEDEFALDDTLEVDPDAEDPFDGSVASDSAASPDPDDNDAGTAVSDAADEGPDWGDTDLDLDDDEDEEDGDTDNEAGEFDDRIATPDDDDDLSWPDPDSADGSADYEIFDEASEQNDDSAPGADRDSTLTTPPEPENEPQPEPGPEPEPEPEPSLDARTADSSEQSAPDAVKADEDFDDLAFISNEDSFEDDEDEEDEDFAFLSDSDEAATKLDLARAYIDMGDSDGAREILAEVVKEGTEAQRRDAESLLARL